MTETTVRNFAFDSPQRMTSGTHHRDPEPLVGVETGKRYAVPFSAGRAGEAAFERPRPEFDNHDAIISSFRALYEQAPPAHKANAARHYLASVRDMGIAMGISEERREHARRVLTKIVNTFETREDPMTAGTQHFTVVDGPAEHLTVARETLREVVEDLGFDWWWAHSVTLPSDQKLEHAATDVAVIVGYWEDGEKWEPSNSPTDGTVFTHKFGTVTYRTKTVCYQELVAALVALQRGEINKDPYQVRAGNDYLTDPEHADGDASTTDLIVQYAAFGKILFG
jgi:hypothetical protein